VIFIQQNDGDLLVNSSFKRIQVACIRSTRVVCAANCNTNRETYK